MTIRKKKYVLFLVLWALVASFLFFSNAIALIIFGVYEPLFRTAIYHLIASTIWIFWAFLLIRFYTIFKSFKWLIIGFSFFPIVVLADSLFRSFIRYLVIDIPFNLDNIFRVLVTLIDTNLLIYSCLSLFIFSSINLLSEGTLALKTARTKMAISEDEFDKITTVLPLDFLTRNINRIIQSYGDSYEKGEELIVKFSDFLRIIIYGFNGCKMSQKDQDEFLISTYEQYICAYLDQNIKVEATEVEEIYRIDKFIDIYGSEIH